MKSSSASLNLRLAVAAAETERADHPIPRPEWHMHHSACPPLSKRNALVFQRGSAHDRPLPDGQGRELPGFLLGNGLARTRPRHTRGEPCDPRAVRRDHEHGLVAPKRLRSLGHDPFQKLIVVGGRYHREVYLVESVAQGLGLRALGDVVYRQEDIPQATAPWCMRRPERSNVRRPSRAMSLSTTKS